MSGSVNRVILLGAIGKYGVQVKFVPSGTPCASFSLVLTGQSQAGQYFSTLVPCEVWGKKVQEISDLEPGQLCLFEGKLAKRKKGEAWELVISGFDVVPIAPQPVAQGSEG
jgi:single-stranded DNA-binding protein